MSNYATDVSPIVVDIETAPLENARDYIDPPNMDDISAPANYKDPEKIAAYIEDAKVKRLADFEADCTSKAALDFNCARIVAFGWWTETHGLCTAMCHNEEEEADYLDFFWANSKQRQIVGFRIREFDLPMMMQRSRYLSINHPRMDLGRYAKGSGIADLYDVLTFQDLRGENIMRRTAKSFARRFGIAVNDPISGGDIPALVAAGEWEKVAAHVTSDVELEVALARRLGVIQPVAELVL